MSNQYLQGIREALTRNATKTSISNLEKQGLQSVRVIRAGRILELIQEAVDRQLGTMGVDATDAERQEVIEKTHSTFGSLMSAETTDDALRKALERAAHLEREAYEANQKLEPAQQELAALRTEYETLLQSQGSDPNQAEGLRSQLDSLSLDLKGLQDEKVALEEQLSQWKSDPLSLPEVAEILATAREELEELTHKFETVQRERDELQVEQSDANEAALEAKETRVALERVTAERDELLLKQSDWSEGEDERTALRERCESLDDSNRELTVRLDEARQAQARLEEREETLYAERETIQARAEANVEKSHEVITSMFEEIRGLKESLASGEIGAGAMRTQVAASSDGGADVLAKLTKDLADRIDKIGKKVGVTSVDETAVSLDAIFSKDLSVNLNSNMNNVKVSERKSESGSSVSDALARMKKFKKGTGITDSDG